MFRGFNAVVLGSIPRRSFAACLPFSCQLTLQNIFFFKSDFVCFFETDGADENKPRLWRFKVVSTSATCKFRTGGFQPCSVSSCDLETKPSTLHILLHTPL